MVRRRRGHLRLERSRQSDAAHRRVDELRRGRSRNEGTSCSLSAEDSKSADGPRATTFILKLALRPAAADKYEPLAKELVATQPDVILAHTTPVAVALQRESRVIPIVFVNVSDPIGSGLVASLARPGGNFTGLLLYEAGVVGKWLAMLKEIAPRLERVALVANPKTSPFDYFLRAAEVAATSLAIKLVPSPVATAADIERAIKSFAGAPNGGLLLPPDTTTICASRSHHRECGPAQTARGLRVSFFCRGRRPHVLWDRPRRYIQASCVLCRPHPARRQTRRPPGAGTDQVRNERQPQDGEGARPRRAAVTARAPPTR